MYEESVATRKSEVGRRITEAMEEIMETLWLVQKFGLVSAAR